MKPLSTFLALALTFAACSSAGPAAETPSQPGTGNPPAQPEAPAQPGPVELRQISRVPQGEQPSLGDANKPNGWVQRYRRVVPSQTPAYVPREQDGLNLVIADPTEDGWLALYESAFSTLGPNRTYRAVLFDEQGRRTWDLGLNRFFSRTTQLEIQDIRYEDGKLYFNEGCQTYARDAQNACSALVRLDPAAGRVDWRTPPLVSNDIFLLHGPYVIAGYGFTDESDFLFLVSRDTGDILARAPLDSAHDYLQVEENAVWAVTYQSAYLFQLPSGAR